MSDQRVIRRCTQCFDEFWSLASEYESHCPPCTRTLRDELTAKRQALQRALFEQGLTSSCSDSMDPPPPSPAPQRIAFSTLADPYVWTPPTRRDADEPLVTADVAEYLADWFAKEPR